MRSMIPLEKISSLADKMKEAVKKSAKIASLTPVDKMMRRGPTLIKVTELNKLSKNNEEAAKFYQEKDGSAEGKVLSSNFSEKKSITKNIKKDFFINMKKALK